MFIKISGAKGGKDLYGQLYSRLLDKPRKYFKEDRKKIIPIRRGKVFK